MRVVSLVHGRRQRTVCRALAFALICSVCGCALPAMAKRSKPKPKISQDHFSCGETCPPSAKEARLH